MIHRLFEELEGIDNPEEDEIEIDDPDFWAEFQSEEE
jgi:hypothetical protein